MPKEEWGVKRVCPTTGKRFYDMNRNPVVSPYTGEAINIETGKRSLLSADSEDAVTKKTKAKEDDLETDVLEDDVEVDLGADVLEDDDDDDNVSLDDIADVPANDDD